MSKKTGYYVRIERNNKWLSLDIAELTQEELLDFFSRMEPDKMMSWIAALLEFIHKRVIDVEELENNEKEIINE
jgi:hypothetical protein